MFPILHSVHSTKQNVAYSFESKNVQTQHKNDVLYGTLESNGPNKYCTVQGVTILHTYHTTVLPHCRTKKITPHIPIDIQMHTLPPPLAQFLSELRGLAVWLKMTNHIINILHTHVLQGTTITTILYCTTFSVLCIFFSNYLPWYILGITY